MLVLSRQRDETIMIGDDIEITVVDVRGDKVRLGINAPSKIAVHRKEVYESIRRENEAAATLGNADDLASLGGLPKAAPSISPGPGRLRVSRTETPQNSPAPNRGMNVSRLLGSTGAAASKVPRGPAQQRAAPPGGVRKAV
jgi:carbon storage regulator